MKIHDVLFWIGLIVAALFSYAVVSIYKGLHLLWTKAVHQS